jgi:uncharacterized protein
VNTSNAKWRQEFDDKAVLLGYHGSQAQGTFRPSPEKSFNDLDVMGVIIQPIEAYMGFGLKETYERKEPPYDVVLYDLRHYIKMCCSMNPTALSLLWLRDNFYIKRTPIGNELIKNRGLFVSKKAYNSFVGYGHSQLKRMHRLDVTGHMGAKRKALVEKFGYDTKAAAHAIRLMRMGIEFLSTGQLNVMREDNRYLVDIKTGLYKLEEVRAESDRLMKLMDEALVRSTLPDEVDMDKAEQLLVGILAGKFYVGTAA